MKSLGIAALAAALLAAIIGWFYYQNLQSRIIRLTPEVITELEQQTAQQDESRIPKPRASRTRQAANENRNLYFGDLHVHTALSFDSYLFGNRIGLDEAYRFAHGEPARLMSGEAVRLSRPLDFVAMTDHGELRALRCLRIRFVER
jgi:hypothetical protein